MFLRTLRELWLAHGLKVFGWAITGTGIAGVIHTFLIPESPTHEFALNLETAITKILIGFAFEIISYWIAVVRSFVEKDL